MGKSKVTDKFQVTIPKDVREAVSLKAGEEVMVEKGVRDTIVVKRFGTVRNPLTVLIGKRRYPRHVPPNELEEEAETR